MPLYEYACEACGERFETIKSASARDEAERCRSCGEPARRVLSAFAVSRGGKASRAASSGASSGSRGGG